MKSLKFIIIAMMVFFTHSVMAMGPNRQAIPPVEDLMFVMNAVSNSISVIDTTTLQKVGEDIPVGDWPQLAVLSQEGEQLFVVNGDSNSISVIDTRTLEKIGGDIKVGYSTEGDIRDGYWPESAVLSQEGDKLFATNRDDHSISVIDTTTLQKVGEDIPVEEEPELLILSQNGERLFVINAVGDSISVIDTSTLEKRGEDIAVGMGPQSAILSQEGEKLFVVNRNSHSISVIDTSTLEKIGGDISVGKQPRSAILSQEGDKLFVVNRNSHSISVIDTTTLQKVGEDIPVGDWPELAVLSQEGEQLFVVNQGDRSVSVIDTSTLEKRGEDISVGKTPKSAILSQEGDKLFVLNANSHSISVIDTSTLEKIGQDIPVGRHPLSAFIFRPKVPQEVREYIDRLHRFSNSIRAHKNVDNNRVLDLLQTLRRVMPKIPDSKMANVSENVHILLQSVNNSEQLDPSILPLNQFFQGVADSITHPAQENTYNNGAFQGSFETISQYYGEVRSRNASHQITQPLNKVLTRVQNILKANAGLSTAEQKVLTFMTLQTCAPSIQEGDKAATKRIRLELLNFIDGYNHGAAFDIPLPGMEEDVNFPLPEMTLDENPDFEPALKPKGIDYATPRDIRTTQDFIQLLTSHDTF